MLQGPISVWTGQPCEGGTSPHGFTETRKSTVDLCPEKLLFDGYTDDGGHPDSLARVVSLGRMQKWRHWEWDR